MYLCGSSLCCMAGTNSLVKQLYSNTNQLKKIQPSIRIAYMFFFLPPFACFYNLANQSLSLMIFSPLGGLPL